MHRHALAPVILALFVACSGTTGGSGSDSDTHSGSVTGTTVSTATESTGTSSSTTVQETSGSGSGSDTGVTATGTTAGTTAGTTTGTTAGTTVGTTGTTAMTTGSTGPVGECVPVECNGKIYECGDCIDNDMDGKIDNGDVECLSPCDDDESIFASGLPGDNVDPCNQDCYFDGNSGSGDDKCSWNLKCDPNNPGGEACPYDPNYKNCPDMQGEQCNSFCQVPNGCDCFGCCTIMVGDKSYDIYLGDDQCSLDNIDNCAQCTKNDGCINPCVPDQCEVCFGQDLPPGCDEPSCDKGDSCTVDSMGNDDCPAGTFCSTGCCVSIIPG